jgi:hypothetical protein
MSFKQLNCPKCAKPVRVPETMPGGTTLKCPACKELFQLPAAVVLDGAPVNVGDAVSIEWNGGWYPGHVLAVEPTGLVRIHYSGYDNSWDEAVPLTRLRRTAAPASATPTAPGQAGAPITNPGPTENDPFLAAVTSRPVNEQTRLNPGDQVRVEWGGKWWAGEVLSLQANGQVRIHYSGWDSSWDETVPRSRLCLPPSGPPKVAVVLDNQHTVKGILVGAAGDYLNLVREGDAVRTLINKQRILYLEVAESK